MLATLAGGTAVLLALAPAISVRTTRRRAQRRPQPLVATGRAVRASLGRNPDPVADRRVGVGLTVLGAVVLVEPVLPLVMASAAALLGRWRRVRVARPRTDDELVAALPEVVDLLSLAVGAGFTVTDALPIVARWAPPIARDGLHDVDRAIRRGSRVVDALDRLRERWGDPARPLLRAVRDHVRYGTPLAPALARLSSDARAARRRAAEVRARRLPVLLLFPLVFCTLPAFGLLTVAPIVAGTLRSLDGERLETTPVSISTDRSENPPCPLPSSPSRSQPCPPSTSSSTPAAADAERAVSRPPSTPSSCSAPPPSPSCS